MKRNWLSLSKAFHRDLQRPVYTLVRIALLYSPSLTESFFLASQDLRNHGSSPHARPMNYEAMAHDILHFFRSHSLSNVSLIGHSM